MSDKPQFNGDPERVAEAARTMIDFEANNQPGDWNRALDNMADGMCNGKPDAQPKAARQFIDQSFQQKFEASPADYAKKRERSGLEERLKRANGRPQQKDRSNDNGREM